MAGEIIVNPPALVTREVIVEPPDVIEREVIVRPPGVGGNYTPGYVHTQVTPSAMFLVQHNLGSYPAGVMAFSTQVNNPPTEYDQVEPLVVHVNANALMCRFLEPFAGLIYIS